MSARSFTSSSWGKSPIGEAEMASWVFLENDKKREGSRPGSLNVFDVLQ